MADSEIDKEILAFDVAFALGVLGLGDELAFDLPEKLEVPDAGRRLVDRCIEAGSITKYGCRIRTDAPTETAFALKVGQDPLYLKKGGLILAGGSGINIQLHDYEIERSYALKLPKISVLAYQTPDHTLDPRIGDRFDNEYEAFQIERQLARRLSHENVAQHLVGASKRVRRKAGGTTYSYPYSVSEWIEGAKSLSEYLKDNELPPRGMVNLIEQSFEALEYIHGRGIIHWDIKSDNVLVGKDGTLKIIDFGNAKYLENLDATKDRVVTTTEGKYPAARILKAHEGPDQGSRRFRLDLPDLSWNNPVVDLWMMAQEWNRCLGLSPSFISSGDQDLTDVRSILVSRYREIESPRSSDDVWQNLGLIFDRVLYPLSDAQLGKHENKTDVLDLKWFYYSSASELLREIRRVEPLLGAGQTVPELLVSLGDVVRLPVTGNSIFTNRVSRLTNSSLASPTKLHLQLAQVREVYPGAMHTRHEHLLGTLTTASYFLRSLYLNEMNAFWRISASGTDIRAVLIAAILHDVGHIAYGHFIEEMGDLMRDAGHVDYVRAFIEACRQYAAGDDWPADSGAAGRSAFAIDHADVVELCEILQRYWCDDEGLGGGSKAQLIQLLERVAAILGPAIPAHEINCLTRSGTRRALDMVMKSIVDGPLDADKLDYLRRDSLHAGVLFANGIDLERFFESLRVCFPTKSDGTALPAAIGVSEKGVAAMESIITARYHLFSVVYWHRTVRGITAILQRLLVETFLALDDADWYDFRRSLIKSFRLKDDRGALAWLEEELEQRGLLDQPVGGVQTGGGRPADIRRLTIANLLDGMRGDRSQYFEMAFELNYDGLINHGQTETQSGLLHDRISSQFHNSRPSADTANSDRREQRRNQSKIRTDLEQKFCSKITELIRPRKGANNFAFILDTILIDVPEAGKDQIAGLYVDRRSKRSRHALQAAPVPDFEDISRASPIAAALSDVFRRWARRIRIFMTRDDVAKLRDLGLEMGDVAAIWQETVYHHFGIEQSAQFAMPGISDASSRSMR